MKLLIGTLKTIENEFEECCKSINGQTYKDFDHIVIENLKNAEAHDKLYSTFQDNSEKYDLLIKVDADMVIADRCLFQKIGKEFEKKNCLDHLYIPTFDHFVKRNMGGVNVYRNTVKWRPNNDNYYTDEVQIKESIRYSKKWIPSETNPLIHHCPDPSDFQAFHFGLHRSIKSLSLGKFISNPSYSRWKMFNEIKYHHVKTKEKNLLHALIGGYIAVKRNMNGDHINYTNYETRRIFEEEIEKFASEKKINNLYGWFNRYNTKKAMYWLFLKTRIRFL